MSINWDVMSDKLLEGAETGTISGTITFSDPNDFDVYYKISIGGVKIFGNIYDLEQILRPEVFEYIKERIEKEDIE